MGDEPGAGAALAKERAGVPVSSTAGSPRASSRASPNCASSHGRWGAAFAMAADGALTGIGCGIVGIANIGAVTH